LVSGSIRDKALRPPLTDKPSHAAMLYTVLRKLLVEYGSYRVIESW